MFKWEVYHFNVVPLNGKKRQSNKMTGIDFLISVMTKKQLAISTKILKY